MKKHSHLVKIKLLLAFIKETETKISLFYVTELFCFQMLPLSKITLLVTYRRTCVVEWSLFSPLTVWFGLIKDATCLRLASQITELLKADRMLHILCGRYIFPCLRRKICKPNLLVVGVTDLELANYNSASQCRTVSAQNQRNPTHLTAPASCRAAGWEKARLSLKVLDWSRLFAWTWFVFSGFFWLFPVKCLLMYVSN